MPELIDRAHEPLAPLALGVLVPAVSRRGREHVERHAGSGRAEHDQQQRHANAVQLVEPRRAG